MLGSDYSVFLKEGFGLGGLLGRTPLPVFLVLPLRLFFMRSLHYQ